MRLYRNRQLALGNRNRRWKDPTKPPNAEEALPARIASVGGQAQKAFRKYQGAPVDPVTRNVVEVEVSALGAMREVGVRECHPARVEAEFTGFTAPGTASAQGEEEIRDATPVRTKAICTAALGTNHR